MKGPSLLFSHHAVRLVPSSSAFLLCQVVFPDGIPDDVHEVPINIDQTPVVKGEKGDGRVLVDSANKVPHTYNNAIQSGCVAGCGAGEGPAVMVGCLPHNYGLCG